VLQEPQEYETLPWKNNWVSEYPATDLRGQQDKATRAWSIARVLNELEEYEKADKRLREEIQGYEIVFKQEHQDTPNVEHRRTPLSWASGNGHSTVVDMLLKKYKLNPNLKDEQSDWAPLSWAGGNGHEAMIKLLVATGMVDDDWKDSLGQTPLLWATKRGREAIIKLLREHVS
jgi:Ankyrin repeats (many copies)